MALVAGGGVRVWASVVLVVGLAGAVGACTASNDATPTTVASSSSTSTAPGTTAPDKVGADGKVDLHFFDGTYGSRRFTAVACAIQDVGPIVPQRLQAPITTGTIMNGQGGTVPVPTRPGQPPGTTLGPWNRMIGCGPEASAGNVFVTVSSLTIDGPAITVRFFDTTCTGTMTTEDDGRNDETEVHIDQIECDGQPAPPLDATLQREGDSIIADGRELERFDPGEVVPGTEQRGQGNPPGKLQPIPIPTTANSNTAVGSNTTARP